MIEISTQTLQYVFVIKMLSMVSQVCIEPYLEKKGYSEKQIQRITVSMEVLEIILIILLLKTMGLTKSSK